MLPKKKNDVSFIDPVTMQVVCTYNQCRTKFVPAIGETVNGRVRHFHECTECKRQISGPGDGWKNYVAHLEQVCKGPGTEMQQEGEIL